MRELRRAAIICSMASLVAIATWSPTSGCCAGPILGPCRWWASQRLSFPPPWRRAPSPGAFAPA